MPVWFAEMGGFEKRANIKYFERFVKKVSHELVDDVAYVITVNEPNVYASFSYLTGLWPPEVKNFYRASKVYWNLAVCHKRAYKILKKHKPSLEIGLATQLANIQAKRPHSFIDELSTKFMRYVWNWFFLNRVRRHQDFVGLNYYFSDYYKNFAKKSNPKIPLNDLGWYMEPEGLYPILLRTWAHYKKPIIITESGLADSHDQNRRWWLEESLVAMEKAISEGVDLRGYFYWSLLDNFEWAEGWWPKFGLVKVDRSYGMKRALRPSAKWFGATIKKIRKL
jgi:beta-glucosidase